MKLKFYALALVTLPFAATAQAGEVTLTPMGGYHVYDQKLDNLSPPGVNDAPVYGGSVGYRFTPHVSGEVEYLRTDGDRSGGAPGKVKDDHLSVNGLYHFNSSGAVQPYALLGVGQGRFKIDNGPNAAQDTVVNAGVGSFYQLSDQFRLRGELRAVRNTDARYTDGMALVGLEMKFGGKPVSN